MIRPLVAVTQRVVIVPEFGERRDALDQRWTSFLSTCGYLAMPVPNDPAMACELVSVTRAGGLLLTGGNDLASVGGDAPERDATERALLALALERGLPILGVCRGMQVIQDHFGVALQRVTGHVTPDHEIAVGAARAHVNSYHGFGATTTAAPLDVWARADDGVVEAVRHRSAPVVGVMWHPERYADPREIDLELFRSSFPVR
jgi:putative glutamine amidotransferase